MEYGVIYIKIVPPKGHKSEWLKYLVSSKIMPESIQHSLKELCNKINSRDGIIIPMDDKVNPGCVTTSEIVSNVVNEMYNGFLDIFKDVKYIRCVYSIMELNNINVKSAHTLDDPGMVKLGRYLDSSDETGIFEV